MAAERVSRPDKLNNAQTILYEIEMLRHAKRRLDAGDSSWAKADQCVYLEDFLLHFRNLIEFFAGKRNRRDTLSIGEPNEIWPEMEPDLSALNGLTQPDLFNKYEKKGDPEKISKYLQHCTTQRTTPMSWDIKKIYADLQPTIDLFEKLVPKADREYVAEQLKDMAFATHEAGSSLVSSFSNILGND
jgi:hypothetical protein